MTGTPNEMSQPVGLLSPSEPKSLDYDAFLSYTHRDRPVVSGIQKGLHHIGRRVGQLRALRVFRDDTDLTASPDLWGRITDALDRSRFFIVTLSPGAAQSYWVNQEISYWLQHRGRDNMLLVQASGQLHWDQDQRSFDPHTSDAAPPEELTGFYIITSALMASSRSFSSTTMRSAVFRPSPGIFVNRARSLPRMAGTNSSTLIPDKIFSASEGPTPDADNNISNNCFSRDERNPYSASASSRTWV